MKPSQFDTISKLFASRRMSRRQALTRAGTGVAATALAAAGPRYAVAQNATPAATPAASPADKTMYLFVQSFQSGTISPIDGPGDRYSVRLDQGLGQTIYFADRPSRDVGVVPTAQFLQGIGFPEDNPPNAALIVQTNPGESDIAVVELFNPVFDPSGPSVSYDVEVLANWQNDLELGFREAPADLATLAPEFGAAHLLIDDCPSANVQCETPRYLGVPGNSAGVFRNIDHCWNYSTCIPCEPYGHNQPDGCATRNHWSSKCNAAFAQCQGLCRAFFTTWGGNNPCFS